MTDQPPSYPPPSGGYEPLPGGYEPPPPPPTPPPGSYGYEGYQPQQPPGGYGYPPPAPGGYGYPPGVGYPPPQGTGTNGFAIASLVCSVVGLACFGAGSLLGLIFGFVALNQIKKSGQNGRGLAIAGLITGGVVTAFWVVIMIIGAIGAATDDGHHRSRYDSSGPATMISAPSHQPLGVLQR